MTVPGVADAGTVILEGSDAIGLHCVDGVTGACTYRDQVWKAIAGSSSLPIAVIGDVTAITSGTHPVQLFPTVAAAGTLANYAALYFVAGGGCCEENDSLIMAEGAQAAVSAYLAGGGTVMIENYTGGAAWDFAVGAGGKGNAHVAGSGGGLSGNDCTDGETVTATGTTNGFTQPPVIGCWTHQAYDQGFFGPLGFRLSFFDADPSYARSNPDLGPFSSLLSNGVTKTGESGGGTLTVSSVDLGTVPQGSPISAGISVSGGTPPYSFTAVGTPPPGIAVSGSVVTGTPTQAGSYSVGIQVTDAAGVSASGAVSFTVFGFTSSSLPPGILFSPYQTSVGVTGGTPPYTFTISGLPSGLRATNSGTIAGTVTSAGTSNVSVSVTDGTGVAISAKLPLVFSVPLPLTVPAQSLPDGQISTIYSQPLSAMGGAPPYVFSLSSGSLPAGLSLRPTGVIAGIPSIPGTFSFGVRATDVTGASGVGAVSLNIAAAPIMVTTGPTTSKSSSTSVSSSLANGVANVEFPAQTISAMGGIAPYTFALTGGSLPPGLNLDPSGMLTGTPTSSGTFSFTVTATDSSGGSTAHASTPGGFDPRATGGSSGTATFSLNVRAAGTDLILSTSGLAFSLANGSTAAPPAQTVGVQSTSTSTPLNYSVSVSPAANWLNVSPSGGATPSTVNVSLNSQALALASSTTPYQTTISVMCLAPAPCAGNSQQIAVSLTVVNVPPAVTIPNSLISFTTSGSPSAPMTQTVTIQNSGGGSLGIASISCGASWCTVGAAPGSIPAGPGISLPVTADPAGLNTGFYRTTITVKTSAGTAIVPVTLFVAGGANLSLEPSGAQYSSIVGGVPNGPDTDFLCVVSSATPVTWNATVISGNSWLSLPSTTGTASASSPGTVNFAIDPGVAASLKAQTYYGTIRVTIPGFVNSPQDFQVILNVSPANTPQRPNPSPTGLLFITAPSGTPPAQTVTVTTNAPAATQFQVSASTNEGASWLSVTPATGTAGPGSPATAQVSVNPSKLSPGVYYGGVNFAFPGIAVRTVNVTLIVNKNAVAHEVSHASGCSPTQLVPAQMGLIGNFSAPVAWPVPVSVQLLDDCANTITNGQVVVTFSNGDPALPLPLANANSGLYVGTWTPRHASSQVSLTARVTAPGLPTASALLAGSVAPNAAPLLAPNAALNVFDPEPGAALAPGSLVQVSGTALAAVKATAPAPLPATLNGTQVIVGGIPAPISAVSPGVLTAQLPFELAPNMQYQVIVSANGALTAPATIQVSGTAAGVQADTAGLLSAFHISGTAISETSPAAPGEIIVLFATGLGATDTPVASGAAGPASPLANAVDQPSITINGENATVSFAGLQPGMVGVYQINATVPSDAPNGDLTLLLSQDGNAANSTVLPVKKGP